MRENQNDELHDNFCFFNVLYFELFQNSADKFVGKTL
jgi:hypothetical protein